MRGSIYGVLALVVVTGLALPMVGKSPAAQTTTATRKPGPDARLPYMAEYKMLRIQSLPDGTVAHETRIVIARDSQGRKMRATTEIPETPGVPQKTHFEVVDPVAHATFSWNFPGREATVMAIPFAGVIPPGCSFAVFGIGYSNEKTTVEDLGTKIILGVEARGRRTSTTVLIRPVGKQKKHKSQARTSQVRSDEIWQATNPDLTGMVVRYVNEDEAAGKTSKELVNFSQSDPDVLIFQPPAGYTIVNREVSADPCTALELLNP